MPLSCSQIIIYLFVCLFNNISIIMISYNRTEQSGSLFFWAVFEIFQDKARGRKENMFDICTGFWTKTDNMSNSWAHRERALYAHIVHFSNAHNIAY